MGFMVDKVELVQDFTLVIWFYLVIFIPSFYTLISFVHDQCLQFSQLISSLNKTLFLLATVTDV
jgi:hypothetical protein